MRAYTTRVFVEDGEVSGLLSGSSVDIYEIYFPAWDSPPSENYSDTVVLIEVIKGAVISGIFVAQTAGAALAVTEVFVQIESSVQQISWLISVENRFSYFWYGKLGEPRQRQKAGATLIMAPAGGDYPTLCATCNSVSPVPIEVAPICTRRIRRGVEVQLIVIPCQD